MAAGDTTMLDRDLADGRKAGIHGTPEFFVNGAIVEAKSPDDLRALLQPAHLSLLGLQNLVNNLLASSAMEAGRFTLRLRATNLHQVITDSLQGVQPLFRRRVQVFSLGEATTVATSPEIQADPARLTLALFTFFVVPAAAFAVWSYRQLQASNQQGRELLVLTWTAGDAEESGAWDVPDAAAWQGALGAAGTGRGAGSGAGSG